MKTGLKPPQEKLGGPRRTRGALMIAQIIAGVSGFPKIFVWLLGSHSSGFFPVSKFFLNPDLGLWGKASK